MEKKTREEILKRLSEFYADAKPALIFTNPFELLIATMLSAQSTDVQVNKVTPELFRRYGTAKKLMQADLGEIEGLIQSVGFYKTKAKHVIEASGILVAEYGGVVPKSIEELIELPGVGRKTASVVISNAYDVPAIAVDTHVFRVSNRLGLAKAKDVYHTEMQLREAIPKADWKDAHHWILWHGRKFCKARKPLCDACFLKDLCVYYIDAN
ncbi:MAG: endonuclease III [Eubacteriales bacterium]